MIPVYCRIGNFSISILQKNTEKVKMHFYHSHYIFLNATLIFMIDYKNVWQGMEGLESMIL